MAPTLFAYPGDEPTSLAAVAVELDEAGTRVERIIQAVTLSRSALKNSWNMQATALADADIGILIGGLPTVRTALDTAQTAVSTHQATLTRIRGEIDDLRSRYLQQDRIFDAAERDYIANSTRTDSAAVNQREHDLATGRAAVAAQQGIAEEYQALLTSANSSAQTCALALTTAWDPTGRSHSSPNGDKGMVLLAGAGISTANLNVLRINNEVAEAAKLATELDGMDWIDATDPATQQKIARLAEIWGRDGHSEIFATGFYNKLGADDTVDLMARIATFIQPNGPADSGPVDAALIHGLQADMANGLALATDGIEYGSDGSLVDNVAGGVNPSWVTDLMEKGRSDVTVPWNDMGGIQVKGYVPLMATLASGSGFSAGVLRALGDDMKSVEEQYAADNHMDTGDTVWNSTAGARVRWDWSANGYDFPMGNDPFTSWTTAALNSGPAATTVLATDSNLLNHLVNDRSWMLRDSGNNMGPTQWLYRIADDDERLEGLSALGNALPTMVGQGALSPDSKQAFDNVIHALGSRDTNPRIGDSTFQATDWIAPELRPGLGDMLVLNADRINEVMANPDLQDASTDNDYYRVIADVAKDPALDSGGGTFIDRMMNAEKSVIDAQMRYNVFSPADLDAQSRLAATMAHGHDAQNVHVQQAADAAHNAKVSAIATAAQLAVDTSSTPLRWTKETYKLFGGDLVQTIAGNFMHDNSLAAVGDNADWSGALRESINISAADQWYANGFADLPAAGPDHHLLDSSGQPVPWSKLSADDKSWVTQNWPSGPENAPVRIA
ncbi:MAG: hypothetical protein ABWZ02_07075, partial [Nakamurella sp.]